jgi:allantoinase
MTVDVLIRGARVVDADQDAVLDVALANGKIAQVGVGLSAEAAQVVDGRGRVLLPGGIDPHVHFNEPGRTDWEGIETGSMALAKGGLTGFFDMPLNSSPVTTTPQAFDDKRRLMDEKSRVNAYLWGGLTPDNLDQLEALAERGVIGFKAFMSNSGIDEFGAADDGTLYRGMQVLARLGKPLAVHAESDSITGALTGLARKAGRVGVRDYLASRPAIAELEAIQRAIFLAGETGCALHIVHVSTGRGVRMVAEAQRQGVDVSCETCPHYLALTEDDVERLGAVAKCAPPVRSADEQAALWALLADGTLPMVASDHSPAPLSLKQGEDFFAIWGGIAGCQSTLALLLTLGYHTGRLSLSQVAAVTSHNVARRFGLTGKGRILAGYDADLALWDIDHAAVLTPDDLAYRHKLSPYVGMTLRGRVIVTWVGGREVYRG